MNYWVEHSRNSYFYKEHWCSLKDHEETHISFLYEKVDFGISFKWHDRKHPHEILFFHNNNIEWYSELKDYNPSCFTCLAINDEFLYPSSYGDINSNKKHYKLTNNNPIRESYLYNND